MTEYEHVLMNVTSVVYFLREYHLSTALISEGAHTTEGFFKTM